ncbi:2,3-bisphosphoglycerate-dependent phosphoglycerate mutase [Xinfangfangia sp. D13-10-4-6]|uniref:2,3-bisphosphoglycerate-dependent phosphoglycerate mutase n=1 Tax=Pseudogemmobacter hezensis TaxID=2737662 RepID=UPI0015529026|nr:2,3-bisphosphoglycerate-dependent phosphoglycerate mutase [Pseudogemmobacter hezensis]NPD14997.1 2,3-bisphosphoglycerate-dependent phosphoglycerate mutase [Pseudogemmobacter hezensis]
MTGTLILLRHGQSTWNAQNLFTGARDPDLTDRGIEEARLAGRMLLAQEIVPDAWFTSALRRAYHTLDHLLLEMGISDLTITRNAKLNERDYGELSGLNKDDARKRWGADQVHIWRRSYEIAPPGGESLLDTANRVLPWYEKHIAPLATSGKTVLVAAHGNSLRGLIMKLEGLNREQIVGREIATGVPILYRIGADGAVQEMEELRPV